MRTARRAAAVCGLTAVVLALTFWLLGARPVTLTIGVFAGSNWDVSEPGIYQAFDTAVARFEQAHPGVTVQYVSGVPREEYPEWLAEQLLLGHEPDVYLVPEADLATLAGLGALEPLDSRIAASQRIDPAAYYPAAWESGQLDGSTYALPYQCVPTMMCVNRTLLDACGIALPADSWTWEDFYAICAAVSALGQTADGRPVFGCQNYTWHDAAVANGLQLFDPSGDSCTFDDIRLQQAILFCSRLQALDAGRAPERDAFRKGQAAFCPMRLSSYRTDQPYMWKIRRYAGFEWDCLTMPAGPNGSNVSEMSTLLAGMSARSRHPALAWELLQMLSADPDYQAILCSESAGLSPLRAVVRGQTIGMFDPPVSMGQVDQAMEQAVSRPTFRGYETALQSADREILRLMETRADLAGGLLGLQRDITKLLQTSQ